jgi:hypothetical protein
MPDSSSYPSSFHPFTVKMPLGGPGVGRHFICRRKVGDEHSFHAFEIYKPSHTKYFTLLPDHI